MNDGLDDIPDISPLRAWWEFLLECLLMYLFFTGYVAAFILSVCFWGWLWRIAFGA